MQSESTFIRRGIVKLSKRKALISSLVKSKGFWPMVRNTAQPLPKFTTKKQRSREVAAMAHECLQKLQGTKGSEVDKEAHTRFGCSTSSSSPSVETAEKTTMPSTKVVSSTTPLRIQRSHCWILKFTADEEKFLQERIDKQGFGQ